jgi:Family of unknown function (DUF5691)
VSDAGAVSDEMVDVNAVAPEGAAVNTANVVSFEDLVTAATVGVSRKPIEVAALAGPAAGHAAVLDTGDAAATVLDAAALLTLARRAGVQPARGITCPRAAAEDAAPELSARAARVLRQIGGADVAPRFASADSDLLADLLTAAREAGYLAPAPLLPDLLDAAVRTSALRPAVGAVLGARGRWLARHRPDWQQVADQVAQASDDPEVWRTGSRGERRGYLANLRDRDPQAARGLLTEGWARETGEERASLLALLSRGLSADDEEFLEAALDDRAAAVRDTARRLLARLPDSAFNRRAAERAAAVLRLERHGLRCQLVASLPGDPDEAAVRDGISARPPSPSIGTGAWLLTQVIAAAPLTDWTARFGLDPREIVALPVDRNLGIEVRAGWRLAAVSQGSIQWAEALLDTGEPDDGVNRPPTAWPADSQLAAVLPADVRATRAAALLAGTSLDAKPADVHAAITAVAGCGVPWSGALADAVVTVLSRAATRAVLPRLPRGLLHAAARCLPASGDRDFSAELSRLAETHPQTWSPLLHAAGQTIALRSVFLEEIR